MVRNRSRALPDVCVLWIRGRPGIVFLLYSATGSARERVGQLRRITAFSGIDGPYGREPQLDMLKRRRDDGLLFFGGKPAFEPLMVASAAAIASLCFCAAASSRLLCNKQPRLARARH